MSKAVYIATTEPNSGKSIISIGLMQLLLGQTAKVGYFRPVVDAFEKDEADNHIQTILSYFEVDLTPAEAYAYTRSQIIQLKNEDRDEDILAHIITSYKAVEDRFDFVLVEGTDFSGEGAIIEWDINVIIAQNLGIPAIIIANGAGKDIPELANNLFLAYDSFKEKGVEVLLAVANKVPSESLPLVVKALGEKLPEPVLVGAIPMNPVLGRPSVLEIAKELKAKILFGEQLLMNKVGGFGVGAMQLRNYLNHLEKDTLVITPGDRADIILGALQAHISANYPPISGIILTGGLLPEDTILKLIEGLSEIVPILSVPGGTFAMANQIGAIRPKIYPEDQEKITTSIQEFDKYIPTRELAQRMITFQAKGITPRMFLYDLLKRAKSNKKHIVLPEGTDERIIRAAKKLVDSEAVSITLLGDPDKIALAISDAGIDLDISQIAIIDPKKSPHFSDYATTLYELRKHKNMNPAMANDLMEDVSYFGTMMVYKGHADGMVSGAVHTTQHTIRPALQFVKMRPGVSVVSSIFFMCLPARVTIFGDCAINPNPSAEQLAEIAISSAETALAFQISPRIAMLSYSSGASGVGQDVDRVREATAIIRTKRPDLKVEGPIQYDAAVDASVGKTKLPDSEVAGQASVFIFPDLNTGNNTYKAVQRETGALAIGPILQGLNKPINDLSRGCTVDDIFNTVIVTAIQAQDIPSNKTVS